jgi:carboxymethylenebutenolidase
MCDDTTETENQAYLERLKLNRREVTAGTGAAVALILTGCTPVPPPSKAPEPAPEPPPSATQAPPAEESKLAHDARSAPDSRRVDIDTPDGSAEAFFVAPSSGQHPGVLIWPDVAGLRDAYRTMATRLATEGYAVLVVNPYYRSAKLPILTTFSEWKTDEGRAKIAPMREALTPEAITKDGVAFAAWLDQQKEVDKEKKLATTGYCMGGPFTFRTAAAVPERVGVLASFHGGGLVTGEATSPHALLNQMKAAALICIAQNDYQRDPEAKTKLREAAKKANITAEIEVYPAQHGWCAIDSPVFDEAQAERAWARMLDIFGRYL